MIKEKKKIVLRKTKKGSSSTVTITHIRKNRRKKKAGTGSVKARKKPSWIMREITEARNTIIEATYNYYWHTSLWGLITTLIALYLPYLLILLPGLSPVVVAGAAAFVTYIIAALFLSYLRRFTVWGAEKLKDFFSRK